MFVSLRVLFGRVALLLVAPFFAEECAVPYVEKKTKNKKTTVPDIHKLLAMSLAGCAGGMS